MSFFGNKPPVFDWAEKPEPTHHYEIALTPEQRHDLIRLIAHEQPKITIKARNYLLGLVKNAVRHQGPPLPDAALDWEGLRAEARRQGCSEVDVLWDRARGVEPA